MRSLPCVRASLRAFSTQREDVSRKVVIQMRARQRPVPTRRIVVRNNLEFVFGAASVVTLSSVALTCYAYSGYHGRGVDQQPALTLRSLIERGPRALVEQLFVHENISHLVFNLAVLLPAGVALAAAPTILLRWVAIPCVFVAAGATSGLVQLLPDVTSALGSSGFSTMSRNINRASTELVRTGAVNPFLEALHSEYRVALSRLRAHGKTRSNDNSPTVVLGASGGALGLASFASLEWALGGARVWPALLVPLILIYTGAGTLLHPDAASPQRPALERSLHHVPQLPWNATEMPVGGGIGDASAVAVGAACWCMVRGLRVSVASLRFLVSAVGSRLKHAVPANRR
jgi:hypothetical protein